MSPAIYEIFRNDQGQWYWHLKAANGEIVAQSEAYDSKANAERGAEDAASASTTAAGVNWEGEGPDELP